MIKNNMINFLINIILIITPLIILPIMSDRFYYPKILFIYVVLGAIVYNVFLQRYNKLVNISKKDIIMGYLLIVMISVFFAEDKSRAIWGSLGREEGLIAIIAYILIYKVSKSHFEYRKKYIDFFLVSSILVSIYGIVQFYGVDPIPRDYLRLSWAGRAFSTMGNPNFLGSYLVLCIPIPLFMYLNEKKIGMLVTTLTIYYCLLLSFTRSALIGFGIILIFILVYALKFKEKYTRFFFFVITILLVTIFANQQSGGKVYGRIFSIGNDAQVFLDREEGYEKAGANRIYIWLRTIDLIKESPWVGYGLENLDTVFINNYSDEMNALFGKTYMVDRAHNEYLHIAVSSGLPALIAYLIFIFLCLKKGYELTKKDIRYLPYLTAISAYLVQAFFNISVVSVAYIFWIFLGVITNENVFEEETSTTLP